MFRITFLIEIYKQIPLVACRWLSHLLSFFLPIYYSIVLTKIVSEIKKSFCQNCIRQCMTDHPWESRVWAEYKWNWNWFRFHVLLTFIYSFLCSILYYSVSVVVTVVSNKGETMHNSFRFRFSSTVRCAVQVITYFHPDMSMKNNFMHGEK